MAIGKTAPNGTLNENGAFYSVPDINTLLKALDENALPEVTAADAGKVLTVSESGEWEAGEGGGGGHLFVNVTWDNKNATMDKNYSEIVTAIRSGIVPVFITDYDNNGVIFYHLSFFDVATEGETPYKIEIVKFGDADNKTNLYVFQSATETGTPTYSGGLIFN